MIPIDDARVDQIIWDAIADSPSRGDFICYTIHAPENAQHIQEAQQKIESITASEIQIPVHYPEAVDRIRALAETGDATAMFHMGKINALGLAGQQDLASAVWWYTRAMEAGEPRAYANLGWFYQSGYGVKQDRKKAYELLAQAAEGGVTSAKAAIGMMLMTGEGCEQDAQKGVATLESVFEEGYINAGNLLSDLYFAGNLVPRDIEAGHQWLFNVVAKGDQRTTAMLGYYLVAGTHGKTDLKRGLALLEIAMEAHYPLAYLWTAALYKEGKGVDASIDKARQIYEKGIQAGIRECQQALDQLDDNAGAGSTSLH